MIRKIGEQVEVLQEKGDVYTRNTDKARQRIAELDQQISEVRASLTSYREQRKRVDSGFGIGTAGGIDATKQANQNLKKEISILENRLNKSLIRRNEAEAANKALKEDIVKLRKKRLTANTQFRKLEAELRKKSEEVEQVMAASNRLLEEKERFVQNVQSVEEQRKEENAAFTSQVEQLEEFIVSQRRLIKDHLAEAAKGVVGMNKEAGAVKPIGNYSPEEESEMRDKVKKLDGFVEEQKQEQETMTGHLEAYEHVFGLLKDFSSINDLNQVVSQFLENEDIIYKTFNYVQHINREIDQQEEMKNNLALELKKWNETQTAQSNSRDQALMDLKLKRSKVQDKLHWMQHTADGVRTELAEYGTHLTAIIEKLGGTVAEASQPPVNPATEADRQSSGTQGGGEGHPVQNDHLVTEANIVNCLTFLEHQVADLMAAYHLAVADQPGQATQLTVQVDDKGKGHTKLHVHLDSADHLEELEVDGPLSMEEMKSRTQKELSRGTPNRGGPRGKAPGSAKKPNRRQPTA